MDTLQKNNYDLAKAMSTLVPQGGPVLCRDEMEEWSASEAMLFEEALEKYGKDFNDIRQDFVSSSSLVSLVYEESKLWWIWCFTTELYFSIKIIYQFILLKLQENIEIALFYLSAALEVSSQRGPVLLHVEDYRSLHPAGRCAHTASFKIYSNTSVTYSSTAHFYRAPQKPVAHFFQKRLKAAEADSKLKQVYIPT